MTEQLECVTDADAGPVRFPVGDDLGRSRGTDFYLTEEQLTDRERNLRDRVRRFCDTEVVPVAGEYWERAEFPAPLLRGYAGLGVAGAAIQGYGCAGISPVGEGFIVAEPARGDGSLATLNAVHSGLAMSTIALLGSAEQRQRWLPVMAGAASSARSR